MEKRRERIDPPDLSEKGGMKDGQPQRSDDRLFMQLLAFGGCADPAQVFRKKRARAQAKKTCRACSRLFIIGFRVYRYAR